MRRERSVCVRSGGRRGRRARRAGRRRGSRATAGPSPAGEYAQLPIHASHTRIGSPSTSSCSGRIRGSSRSQRHEQRGPFPDAAFEPFPAIDHDGVAAERQRVDEDPVVDACRRRSTPRSRRAPRRRRRRRVQAEVAGQVVERARRNRDEQRVAFGGDRCRRRQRAVAAGGADDVERRVAQQLDRSSPSLQFADVGRREAVAERSRGRPRSARGPSWDSRRSVRPRRRAWAWPGRRAAARPGRVGVLGRAATTTMTQPQGTGGNERARRVHIGHGKMLTWPLTPFRHTWCRSR